MAEILIVEDDETLRNMYSELLSKRGHTVRATHLAEDGLKQAREKCPEIILLDIMLPGGMHGFEFLDEAKSDPYLYKVPVIVFSNLTSQKEEALKYGARAFVEKSGTSPDDVISIVESHLPSGQHSAHRED